ANLLKYIQERPGEQHEGARPLGRARKERAMMRRNFVVTSDREASIPMTIETKLGYVRCELAFPVLRYRVLEHADSPALRVLLTAIFRCFMYSNVPFKSRRGKWLLSDMRGCRRGTRTWPASLPICRPPAAAISSRRRPRARRPTGRSLRR